MSSFSSFLDVLKDPNPPTYTVPFIFRVPNEFRTDENEKFIKPTMISIGPLHHYDDSVNEMKKTFARLFVQRVPGGATRVWDVMNNLEPKIRASYKKNQIKFDDCDFLKMISFDGLFVVELLLMSSTQQHKLVAVGNIPLDILRQDLLKIENQLPFFVLKELYDLQNTNQNQGGELILLALKFFDISPVYSADDEPMHLLEIVLNAMVYKDLTNIGPVGSSTVVRVNSIEYLKSAYKLKYKRNIKFVPNEEVNSVEFNRGIFTIPPINIHDYTIALIWNAIVFERLFCKSNSFTSYIVLMKALIKDERDFEILRKAKILICPRYEPEEVISLFRNLFAIVSMKEISTFEASLSELRIYYSSGSTLLYRFRKMVKHNFHIAMCCLFLITTVASIWKLLLDIENYNKS